MREWQWQVPPGWPFPTGGAPGADYSPEPETWPPAPDDWLFWRPAGGFTDHDDAEINRLGYPQSSQSLFDEPPVAPEVPPLRWVPPPGWPEQPRGWVPPADWRRPREWPRPPWGWKFWQVDRRPHEEAVAGWTANRSRYFEQGLATAYAASATLSTIEKVILHEQVTSRLESLPINTFAAFVGSDVPSKVRRAQRAVHDETIGALLVFRDRAIRVAQGRCTVDDVDLVGLSNRCREHLERSVRADAKAYEDAIEMVNARIKAKPRKAQIGWEAIGMGDVEHEIRRESALAWVFSDSSSSSHAIKDWQDAEVAAARHMRDRLGYTDATTTGPGTDDGIDVRAFHSVAQVKRQVKPVGQPDVQRLVGAAESGVDILFYSWSGYSAKAVDYATSRGVALFRFDPPGEPVAVNTRAEQMLR